MKANRTMNVIVLHAPLRDKSTVKMSGSGGIVDVRERVEKSHVHLRSSPRQSIKPFCTHCELSNISQYILTPSLHVSLSALCNNVYVINTLFYSALVPLPCAEC